MPMSFEEFVGGWNGGVLNRSENLFGRIAAFEAWRYALEEKGSANEFISKWHNGVLLEGGNTFAKMVALEAWHSANLGHGKITTTPNAMLDEVNIYILNNLTAISAAIENIKKLLDARPTIDSKACANESDWT